MLKDIFDKSDAELSEEVLAEALQTAIAVHEPDKPLVGLLCSNREQLLEKHNERILTTAILIYKRTYPLRRLDRRHGLIEFLSDDEAQQYLRRKAAENTGKEGGRPKGSKSAKIEWLENYMRDKLRGNPSLSAKEFFNMLAKEWCVQENGESLYLNEEFADKIGCPSNDVHITLNTIKRSLTNINRA